MKSFYQGWCKRGLSRGLLVFLLLRLQAETVMAAGGARIKPIEDSWSRQRPSGPVAGRGSARSSFDLRILTYNVHGLPLPGLDPSRYSDIGSLLKQRRLAGVAPQIVVLQEMVAGRTAELIEKAGYPYVAKGAPGGGVQVSSGLVILSELPILNSKWIVYNFCTSWDCFSRKGALQVDVSIPGMPRPLKIYNTHMNSNPDTDFWTPTEDSIQARITQMQELREFIWDTRGGQSALIVTGDFNFRKGEEDYESLFSFMTLQDAAVVCSEKSSCAGRGVAQENAPLTIDHHFYDAGGGPFRMDPLDYGKVFTERYRGRLLSDHDGIETVLRLSW